MEGRRKRAHTASAPRSVTGRKGSDGKITVEKEDALPLDVVALILAESIENEGDFLRCSLVCKGVATRLQTSVRAWSRLFVVTDLEDLEEEVVVGCLENAVKTDKGVLIVKEDGDDENEEIEEEENQSAVRTKHRDRTDIPLPLLKSLAKGQALAGRLWNLVSSFPLALAYDMHPLFAIVGDARKEFERTQPSSGAWQSCSFENLMDDDEESERSEDSEQCLRRLKQFRPALLVAKCEMPHVLHTLLYFQLEEGVSAGLALFIL